jgi:hypothetical protein
MNSFEAFRARPVAVGASSQVNVKSEREEKNYFVLMWKIALQMSMLIIN